MRQSAPVLPTLDQRSHKTPENQIYCPECGEEISLSEALLKQYADKFEKVYKQKEQVALALYKQKEDILAKRALVLERDFAERLQAEKAAIDRDIRESLKQVKDLEMEDLRNKLGEQNKRLSEAMTAELDFRKKSRDLEEKVKTFELELIKTVESEKAKIEEEISKRLTEGQRLKLAEKDKQLEDMRSKIEELKRKSELTSQQLQGEVLEIELETSLKRSFLYDHIEPVAKGVRGGDIIHKILNSSGQLVGTIAWETKRTKNWTDSWIEKIKEDQRAIAAECAVIVSDVLPKGVAGMGLYQGVWVCDTKTALGLASALRAFLLQVFAAKASVAGKEVKMEIMYRYLTGTQFSQSIQAMVEVIKSMKETLENEKKAHHKLFAQREKQLEEIILNTASVYGSVQGIVGGALPVIETLEITAGAS